MKYFVATCLLWLLFPLSTASTLRRFASNQIRQRDAAADRKQKKQLGKKRKQVGTTVSLLKPTTERCSRWFGRDDDDGARGGFNHDSAGMTNPSLEICVNNQVVMHVSNNEDVLWWPKLPSNQEKNKWRVLRYRSRIGFGKECYEKCRDASLSWEFSTPQMGIVCAESSSEEPGRILQTTNGCGYHSVKTLQADHVCPLKSTQNAMCICSGSGRRLATYTEAFSTRLLPKLYVVNPVRMVYELVDTRCRGTTYTSSAYATVKGHWIRGEERVTVALRDEGHVDVEILSYSRPGDTLMGKIVWPFIGSRQNKFFEKQMEALRNVATPRKEPQPIPPIDFVHLQ